MKELPTWASRYLQRLGLPQKPPGFSYLQELCLAHLNRFPYENVSKLLAFGRKAEHIPTVEQFVSDAFQFDFGGTCFANNGHFLGLLRALGFDGYLVSLADQHVGIIMQLPELNGEAVYVDIAACAPLFTPVRFQTNPDNRSSYGIEEVRIAPDPEAPGRYRFLRYRRGELVSDKWHFHPDEKRELSDLTEMVNAANQPGALFLSCLRIQLYQTELGRSVSLWNNSLHIRGADGSEQQLTLSSIEEVERAIDEEFGLSRLPVRAAVDVLTELGVNIFKPETQ